jgi:hypothetical protein
MSLIYKAFFSVTLMMIAATTSLACLCYSISPEESFKSADVVFVGRLLGETSPRKKLFEVEQIVKGSGPAKLEVDISCYIDTFLFADNHRFLMYAKKQGSELVIVGCPSGPFDVKGEITTELLSDSVSSNPVNKVSMWEIATITAVFVSISLSVGYLVETVRKRRK